MPETGLSVTVDQSQVTAGESVTFTAVLTASPTISEVTFIDLFTQDLISDAVVTASSGEVTVDEDAIFWLGSVEEGQPVTISIQVTLPEAGVVTSEIDVSWGYGVIENTALTVEVLPSTTPSACNLYPIGLHSDVLAGAAEGEIMEDIQWGNDPGEFNWLYWRWWTFSLNTLVNSLTPPGDSNSYVNPHDPTDYSVSVDDWGKIRPDHFTYSSGMLTVLAELQTQDIVVPVWDNYFVGFVNGVWLQKVQIVSFAQIRLTDYDLLGTDEISLQFLGYVPCGE